MAEAIQNLRFAARMLRKSPLFTAVSVLTLALGIGANSSIFTVIDAVLLKPLPFPEPGRLALVWEETAMFGLKDSPAALGNYTEWRSRNRTFREMGAIEERSFRLTGGSEARLVDGSLFTASAFRALGMKPALGRLFREEEDRPGAAKTALLSDRLWKERYGGDAGVIGREILVNDEKYSVIGVMAPGVHFPSAGNDLWAPMGSEYDHAEYVNRGRHNFLVVARLRPGVTLAQANQDIRGIAASLEREYPATNRNVGAFVAPLREHFVGETRTVLLVLAGAVGFVLLIACANIANLLLARSSHRTREIAIRTAIGAGRSQVIRQLITENLLLSMAGAAGGLLLAALSVPYLERLVPGGISSMHRIALDWRVLSFTLALSVVTTLLFGLAPAFQTLKVDLHHVLKQGGPSRGSTPGARGLKAGLVVTEVALAFVLTVSAALLLQTLARLRSVDPGFETKNILTLRTPLSRQKYGKDFRFLAFNNEVLRRVKALPGVVSAGFTNHVPIAFKGDISGFAVEGRQAMPGEGFSNANIRFVTNDYMSTLGIPLRAGRYLDTRDREEAPKVALINETMQRRFWGNESAVGKRLRFGSEGPWVTVVGVVGDILQSGLDAPPAREMYLPAEQVPSPATSLVMRTSRDPVALVAAVRREIRAVDPDVPVVEVRTMDEILDREVFQRRVQMLLLTVFAGTALLLAAIGIYGVLAYLVAQRTREIGVRVALGASPADVLYTVAGRGVGLSAAGILAGALGAAALTRVLSGLLFGISATDPVTFLSVASLLLAVSAGASVVPALKAMRVDPIAALREE